MVPDNVPESGGPVVGEGKAAELSGGQVVGKSGNASSSWENPAGILNNTSSRCTYCAASVASCIVLHKLPCSTFPPCTCNYKYYQRVIQQNVCTHNLHSRGRPSRNLQQQITPMTPAAPSIQHQQQQQQARATATSAASADAASTVQTAHSTPYKTRVTTWTAYKAKHTACSQQQSHQQQQRQQRQQQLQRQLQQRAAASVPAIL